CDARNGADRGRARLSPRRACVIGPVPRHNPRGDLARSAWFLAMGEAGAWGAEAGENRTLWKEGVGVARKDPWRRPPLRVTPLRAADPYSATSARERA